MSNLKKEQFYSPGERDGKEEILRSCFARVRKLRKEQKTETLEATLKGG